MAEIGLIHGLAYRHNFQADMQNALQLKGIERQYAQDARTRNKLMMDELNFGVAKNAHDRRLLTEKTDKQMVVIGDLIADAGGDVFSDLSVYANFKRESAKLLQLEPIYRAARVEENRKNMEADLVDPKMSMYKPEIQKQMEVYGRYSHEITGGSMTENPEDKVEFVYSRPGTDINLIEIYQTWGNKIPLDNYSETGYMFERSVSDKGIQGAADQLIEGLGPSSKAVNRQWQIMLEDGKAENYDNDIKRYVFESLKTWIRKSETGRTAASYRTTSSNTSAKQQDGLLMKTVRDAFALGNGIPVRATWAGTKMLYEGKDKKPALNDVIMFDILTEQPRLLNITSFTDVTYTNSHVVVKDGIQYMSAVVQTPAKDFDEIYGEDIIDNSDWFGLWLSDPEIRSKYIPKEGIKKGTKANLNQVILKRNAENNFVLEYTVWKRFNAAEHSTSGMYDKASGVQKPGGPDYSYLNVGYKEEDKDGNVWEVIIK